MTAKKVFYNDLKLGDILEYPDIDGKTKFGIFLKRKKGSSGNVSTVYMHRTIILFTEGKFFKKDFSGYAKYLNLSSNFALGAQSAMGSNIEPTVPSTSSQTSLYYTTSIEVKILSSTRIK